MNPFYIYIAIIILILFLMYVYKKQCDEDYYLSLIRFTQQQCQYNFPNQPQYNYVQVPPQYYNMNNKQNYFQHFNQINDNEGYKTPKRKKSFHIYKDFSGLNNPSPSPTINFTNNHFIREKIVLNNLRNNDYNYGCNNDDYQQHQNGNINKKIFKLEDFLTDSKMKNSINSPLNDDGF